MHTKQIDGNPLDSLSAVRLLEDGYWLVQLTPYDEVETKLEPLNGITYENAMQDLNSRLTY